MVQGATLSSYRSGDRLKNPVNRSENVELFSWKDEDACRLAEKPVRWQDLPHRGQLLILGLCRMVDFLQVASFQTFMFYQLKSFDTTLPDAIISWQAGVLQGGFIAAQFLTAVPWGRVADASWCGRKNVILIGLLSTAGSCIGLAFSTSFLQAIFWRVLGGAMNGTVGIIRTMVSENVKEKKYQSRAFLILPLSFNVAAFLGPVLGGFLADLEDPNSGRSGRTDTTFTFSQSTVSFPYAMPSLLNAMLLLGGAAVVSLGLEETLESRRHRSDTGIYLGRQLLRLGKRSNPIFKSSESQMSTEEQRGFLDNYKGRESNPSSPIGGLNSPRPSNKILGQGRNMAQLPFLRIFTRNVLWTLLAQAFFDFHLGAFSSIWPTFISSKKSDRIAFSLAETDWLSPLKFSGDLKMQVQTVGLAMAILGVKGMLLQLTVYPKVHFKLGTVRCIAPGKFVWLGLTLVAFLFVGARTFTLPATIMLLNNCSPHPSVLGTVHGIGQSVSAIFRTIGPVIGGYWYGIGSHNGIIGTSWWAVALVSAFGWITSCYVEEGCGHELVLPGDNDSDED